MTPAPSIRELAAHEGPADLVGGAWLPLDCEGDAIESRNPAQPSQVVWRGVPRSEHASQAVAEARRAQAAWAALSRESRAECLRAYAERCKAAVPRLAELITREVGKTIAESTAEARLLADKVSVTLDTHSMGRVADYEVSAGATRVGRCHFRPLGVMAVIGPYNFPAHLPNGQIVPALLLGNAVVFKPSEKAPATAQALATLLGSCVPPGVFNLVQGRGDAAAALVAHAAVDGVLFTGSWPVGRRILEANLDRPGRMVALEMGGNNAAVVLDDAPLRLAVLECARAAFATTGQRCTCTRRIVVQRGIADRFIRALVEVARSLTWGPGSATPPVFMGPLVSREARQSVLDAQQAFLARGAQALLAAQAPPRDGWFITPGVLRVDRFTRDDDFEVFGPLVRVAVVDTLDEAIAQANASEFGLAASIFTASESNYRRFLAECRAGCINWNNGTAGASGKLPFGGLGRSGNLRPAGAFCVDACAAPVASMVESSVDCAAPEGMPVDDRWFA